MVQIFLPFEDDMAFVAFNCDILVTFLTYQVKLGPNDRNTSSLIIKMKILYIKGQFTVQHGVQWSG